MRDDELRRTLSDANPWWAAKAAGRDPTTWQEANRTLRDRRQFDLGYRSTILSDIASGAPDGSLVILTGSARVPWGGPINAICWPGCGRMSVPMMAGLCLGPRPSSTSLILCLLGCRVP